MGWATGLMVYLVIWWTVLFAVLPLGVKRVENPGRGQDHGAPERPELKRKAIITTLVSAVLWLAFFMLQYYDVFSFRRMVDGLS
jgi:predicted secreted protein